MEEPINDGQTQRTEQTLVSCTAVKAGHTVSDSIEGSQKVSASNSPNPAETPSPNIFFTTSKKATIPSIFINTSPPKSKSFQNSISEDSDNDNLSPTTHTILGKPNNPSPSSLLDLYNPTTCYNKFLSHYKLQLLPSPQTLASFIQFIKLNYPEFFSEQYIKISIQTKSKQNPEEAHIYLPHETSLIPNHSWLSFKNLTNFQNIPLKSNYPISTNIPSLQTCELSLNQSSNYSLLNSSSISEYASISIKIASLNINGLTQPNKKLSISEILNNNSFEILGLSETHFSTKEGKFFNNQIPNYTSFWSSYSSPHQAGVGIFIHHSIAKHIARSHNYKGHIIGLDLHFKNLAIRLLQIYIPTQEKKQLRRDIQEHIISLTQNSKYKLIIMGDFNSVPNPRLDRLPPKKSSIPESQLIKYLQSQQYKDIYRFFFPNIQNFTFKRANTQSRIDQFWTNLSITNIEYTDILSNLLQESDHHLISLEITIILNKAKPLKQRKRKCFLWKNCSKEILHNYASQTSCNLQRITSKIQLISNQNQLNLIWSQIRKALTKAAIKHIPFKKIKTIKEIQDSPPSKKPPLFYRYKQIQFLKNHFHSPNFPDLLDQYLIQYPENSLQTKHPTYIQTKNEFELIKSSLNYQYQQNLYNEIKQKIENRDQIFKETPKLFYKNILEKHNNINIDRLLLNNTLLTEHNEILNQIHNHFSDYFSEKPLHPIPPDFSQLYQPRPELEPNYIDLFETITDQEWSEVVSNLPNQKAAGPSEICYEHIKYASPLAQNILKSFINKCFELQKTPTEWKSSNIFLIPKKSSWDFTLNQVRPISIIEPVKKIFTKIFTNRLDKIISSNNLLSNLNFAASKNSSTHTPIQILHNTIEHYISHNKEAWLLFQDMSKAFDRINIKRLQDACRRIGIPASGINLITELHTSRLAKVITGYGLTSPIQINSGIEQGETYSPLLWKIYYDPILTYISQKYNNHFLKISTFSPLETISNTPPTTITIPPLAYMDDTVWHCEHPEILQDILNDASALYKLNNIEVNPAKSDLLHISSKNSRTSNHFTYNNQTITPRKPENIIRYLGIFYDGKGSTKPTLDTLYNKIENFLLLIRYKKLLPSQISSLFNLILQPSLEYLLQIIPIQKNIQTKLSRLLSIQTKKMLSLAKNTNNISLTNPLTFNLPTFTNIIQKVSVSNIERIFNTFPLLHNIGILRIKSWLSKIWFPKLTKETLLTHYRKTQNYTLLFHLSQLARNNITITLPPQITNYPPSISIHSPLIYNILPPTPNNLTLNSLKNNKILFIEQITTADNNFLLSWNNIYLRTNKATRGRQPSWFTRLSQMIQTNPFQTI